MSCFIYNCTICCARDSILCNRRCRMEMSGRFNAVGLLLIRIAILIADYLLLIKYDSGAHGTWIWVVSRKLSLRNLVGLLSLLTLELLDAVEVVFTTLHLNHLGRSNRVWCILYVSQLLKLIQILSIAPSIINNQNILGALISVTHWKKPIPVVPDGILVPLGHWTVVV